MGVFSNIYSFLFQRSSAEERVATYVIREHERGRPLAEILEDRYVQNRLAPEGIRRLLDRPEVVHAVGAHELEAAQAQVSSAPSA